jgi:hypothetical protein
MEAGQLPASPTPRKKGRYQHGKGNLAKACNKEAVVQKHM